ncbi:hypothetical protein Sd1012_0159 [Shigella dysenteriae 1012]|nr:hypothetical protein Sd1012_0159 [Shigella dysenteriae 1012]
MLFYYSDLTSCIEKLTNTLSAYRFQVILQLQEVYNPFI